MSERSETFEASASVSPEWEYFCSGDHIGVYEEPTAVAPPERVPSGPAVTACCEAVSKNNLIAFILPDVAGAGQHASRFLTDSELPGVQRGKILQSGMITSGGRGVMIFQVEFTLEADVSPDQFLRPLKTYCREKMALFLARSASFESGRDAPEADAREFYVDVFPHDPVGDGDIAFVQEAIAVLGAGFSRGRDRSTFPTFSLLARGPGNSGDQALILDNLLKGANNLVSVRELAAMHYAPDRSVVKVVFELRDPIRQTREEVAAQIERKLRLTLPEYDLYVRVLDSPVFFFGHDAQDLINPAGPSVQRT